MDGKADDAGINIGRQVLAVSIALPRCCSP